MDELLYRVFRIWAYTVSHSFLLLRSPLRHSDQDDYDENYSSNIDIEFGAVVYMDIPVQIVGIEIIQLDKDIPEKLLKFTDMGFTAFEIRSSDQKVYYIVAGSYRVGKNKWISEDRVFNMGLEHDSIIGCSK